MSDTVEFLLTFIVSVGFLFIAASVLAYFGYTQKPRSKGLLTLAALFIALAFLAGIGTILFFTLVPPEARNRPYSTPADPVADYQREVDSRLGRIGASLEKLSPLLLSPQFTPDWQKQVTDRAAGIQVEYEVIGRMNPPPKKAQSHRALFDALGDCDRAMARLADGIDRIDNQALDEANELLKSCNDKISALK